MVYCVISKLKMTRRSNSRERLLGKPADNDKIPNSVLGIAIRPYHPTHQEAANTPVGLPFGWNPDAKTEIPKLTYCNLVTGRKLMKNIAWICEFLVR